MPPALSRTRLAQRLARERRGTFAGFVSKGASRHWLMTMSLVLSSLLTLVAAFTPH
ncbi:hypothetical protein [Burkholderia ambifaria]|uniref:hypothetical protein n=1 Tax=Burkholderia ambifaria TaxID=152480 RepID=UPI00158BFDA6|nr:hypothetical protein [Burkholderia ambifaria]